MADVFVSYAAEDRERVAPLISLLEREGWSVWWDRDLHAGPSFSAIIQRELDAARCVVVVWSVHSIESGWCRDEAQEGLDREALVPVLVDEVRPPLGFRSIHTASLVGWPGADTELDVLLEGVRSCVGEDRATETTDAQGASDPGIAILPFTNLSADPEQEFFCEGLAEDLIDMLVRGSALRVIARTSSSQFKGTAKDVRDIGSQLDVTHVLEGSVRRAGNRIRVSVQLVDTGDGSTTWSDRYDRELDDIFDLQEEIAGVVAGALNARFSGGGERKERNPDAHILVMQAKHLLDLGGDSAVVFKARDLLEQALELDPENADAWCGIQRAYGQLSILVINQRATSDPLLKDLTLEEVDQLGAGAGREALRIDPTSIRANVSRAWGAFFRGDFGLAATRLHTLIEAAPEDLEVLHTLVRPLIWSQRYEDAITVSRYLLHRDPLNVIAIANFALALFADGQLEACRVQIDRGLALNPNEPYLNRLLGRLLLQAEDAETALELVGRFPPGSIEGEQLQVMALADLGRSAEAETELSRLQQDYPDMHYQIAEVYAHLGEWDDAFRHLDQAVTRAAAVDRFGRMNTLIDPRWLPYHDDPRWLDFRGRTGQTEADLKAFDLDISCYEK